MLILAPMVIREADPERLERIVESIKAEPIVEHLGPTFRKHLFQGGCEERRQALTRLSEIQRRSRRCAPIRQEQPQPIQDLAEGSPALQSELFLEEPSESEPAEEPPAGTPTPAEHSRYCPRTPILKKNYDRRAVKAAVSAICAAAAEDRDYAEIVALREEELNSPRTDWTQKALVIKAIALVELSAECQRIIQRLRRDQVVIPKRLLSLLKGAQDGRLNWPHEILGLIHEVEEAAGDYTSLGHNAQVAARNSQ